MKHMKLVMAVCFLGVFLITEEALAQKRDTVRITADMVNVKALRQGTHQYLVYFKAGDDSSRVNYQFWTRKIDFVTYNEKQAVEILQVWEDNAEVVHTVKSYCDPKSFAPLYHEIWWKNFARMKGESKFDYITKTASRNGVFVTQADTAAQHKRMYDAFKKSTEQYVLNWHLDLEVFPILPYKENTVFLINFYDPGFGQPSEQAYLVKGSDVIVGYDNTKIDCWILTHDSKFGTEKFWISKKTKEVLKLEQVMIGGKYKYRYKVKLGFSV